MAALAPSEREGAGDAGETGAIERGAPRRKAKGEVALALDSDDQALADQLGRSQFDRDWARVAEVGRVLRARRTPSRAAAPAKFHGAAARGSLIVMDHEYRREAFLLELQGHANRATESASGDVPIRDREQRLRDLFLSPEVDEDAALVRRDAAFFLGLLRTDAGRATLARSLDDPNPEISKLAAESLARAGDPKATAILVALLEKDLDPQKRALAARALGWTREAATGEAAATTLAKAAREDRDRTVRTHAIASLARVDLEASPQARDALGDLVEDEGEDVLVRQACVAALRAHRQIARTLPAELVRGLERALGGSTAALREEVINALGEAGDAETLPQLEGALLASKGRVEEALLREAVEAIKRRTAAQQ